MKLEVSTVTKILLTEVERLDPITVLLEDLEPRKGKITIECYSKSWSAYWGGMGDNTIAEFFCSCDNGYLSGNLSGVESRIIDIDKINELIREHDEHADLINGNASMESLFFHSEIMTEVFGEEWWHNDIPKKQNPEHAYLCRIIDAVRDGLNQLAQAKAA